MTTVADEFSSSTKDLLAKRSGYICAYPGCRRMTVAVSDDRTSGLTMTGVAAHIAAARSGGPRFDSIMGSDERASERNGIWTCQIHGKAIDDNPSTCTVEELRRWKSQHEQWVFDRVMGGTEKLHHGIARLKLRDVGMFNGERELPLGRHNVLLGLNESGKTTICEILAAFAGGLHWQHFAGRFTFNTEPRKDAFIEALHVASDGRNVVRLSPQHMLADGGRKNRQRWRTHVELNGSPTVDWPRSLFRVLAFGDQLFERHHTDLKDRFSMALRNLASALSTDEDLVWGSLRDELFTNSLFGYRFRRTGHRKVNILVPDGRDFYVPHRGLSFSEQHMAVLEIGLKLTSLRPRTEGMLYIFDSRFFERLDSARKAHVFRKVTSLDDGLSQTLFCVNHETDAESLKDARMPMATAIGKVDDSPALTKYLGGPAPAAIGAVMREFAGASPDITILDGITVYADRSRLLAQIPAKAAVRSIRFTGPGRMSPGL